jgi:hypothetical protein
MVGREFSVHGQPYEGKEFASLGGFEEEASELSGVRKGRIFSFGQIAGCGPNEVVGKDTEPFKGLAVRQDEVGVGDGEARTTGRRSPDGHVA